MFLPQAAWGISPESFRFFAGIAKSQLSQLWVGLDAAKLEGNRGAAGPGAVLDRG